MSIANCNGELSLANTRAAAEALQANGLPLLAEWVDSNLITHEDFGHIQKNDFLLADDLQGPRHIRKRNQTGVGDVFCQTQTTIDTHFTRNKTTNALCSLAY
jgi:hypothetical protein